MESKAFTKPVNGVMDARRFRRHFQHGYVTAKCDGQFGELTCKINTAASMRALINSDKQTWPPERKVRLWMFLKNGYQTSKDEF